MAVNNTRFWFSQSENAIPEAREGYSATSAKVKNMINFTQGFSINEFFTSI